MKGVKIISILLSILCIILILPHKISYAADELTTINLAKSKELLEEKNLELLSLKRQIELQEIIIEETNHEAKLWMDRLNDDSEGKRHENATKVYVNPIKEENKLASLQRQYQDKLFDLSNNLQEIYIDLLNITNKLNSLNKNLDIAKTVYQQKLTEVNLGLLPEKELLTFEVNIKAIERDIKQSENTKQLQFFSFNYMITGSTEIIYQPELMDIDEVLKTNYMELSDISYEELLEKQLEKSDTYQSYEELLREYEKILYVERNYSSSGAATTKTLQSIKNTELKMKDLRHKTMTSIMMSYYELMNKQLDIKIANNNLTISENKLKVAETKFELALISSTELLTEQLNHINAQQNYIEALNNYDISYINYIRYY